jgi:hypothetical protein
MVDNTEGRPGRWTRTAKVGAGQAEERAAVEIVVWNYELEVRGGGTRDGTLYLGRLVLQ